MRIMKLPILAVCLSVAGTACSRAQDESNGASRTITAASSSEVVLVSDVEWRPLNPARGDNGPKAADLWGDRTGSGPSGFLVEFSDGFESPPHIHNVSYRGMVISGLVHNDDPDAGEMWMPAGSFWTQPKGGVHITAAKGHRNLAFIEIEEGPYLVRSVEEAFECEEAPINVAASNIVWIDPAGALGSKPRPKVAYLWGEPQEGELNGALLKLPTGFAGTVRSHGSTLHAVVIQGRPWYRLTADADIQTLEPGSSFSSEGESAHQISCDPEEDCVIYLRTEGQFDVVSAER